MRTGTADKIAAAFKDFHGTQIDFLVAAIGLVRHLRALGKRGRIKNDAY